MSRNQILGLILAFPLALVAGCQGKSEESYKSQEKSKSVNPPEFHPHHYDKPGPNGGKMADLGTDHRLVAEITFSEDPRAIRVYVVDHNDFKKPMPIEAASMVLELHGDDGEQIVNLSADPQEGEEDGKASQFVVEGVAIPESIQDLDSIEGHLEAKVGDQTLKAEFGEHEDHDE